MKRGRLKKKSKQSISVLQENLWELCKQIIRKLYPNVCYTCYAPGLAGRNWQTGHMWAKGSLGAFMKYDLRILRPQCMKCNIWHGGMGAKFYQRMLEENGAEYMKNLDTDRQKSVKAYDHYLVTFIKYESLLKSL